MSQLPVIYNRSLLSFANHTIRDPIMYARFVTAAQLLLDQKEEDASKLRLQERCKQVKEEIMMRAWHPSRVEKLLLAGYDIEDM